MSKYQGRNQESGRHLVERIVGGDEQAFTALYELYYARVRAFTIRRVSNPADVEDITQEVFLQIHRSLPSFRGRSSLSTWIFGIAHNVVCRFHRKQRGVRVPLENAEVDAKLSFRPRPEGRIDAARALERCDHTLHTARDDRHQQIFELFYGRGRPMRVIANALGCKTDTVKVSLRRSRDVMLRDPDLRSTLFGLCA